MILETTEIKSCQKEMLNTLMIFHSRTCLHTQKLSSEMKEKLGGYTSPNRAKTQLDYVFINRKCINSILNCVAYFSFQGVSPEHRILSVKIRQYLRRNKKQIKLHEIYIYIYIYREIKREIIVGYIYIYIYICVCVCVCGYLIYIMYLGLMIVQVRV